MSKKKTRVSEQFDSLLSKLQPGFRTKKKEALADFSVFFFSKRSETVNKDDVLRLFVGEGKRIGLLAICGKRSKSSGAMQRASLRAIELVAGLMDKTKNPTDWFLFLQVFVTLDAEYVKLMCLSEHESSPAVVVLRNYRKNVDQFKAEADSAERQASPDDPSRASSADLARESTMDEKKAPAKGGDAAASTLAGFKRGVPSLDGAAPGNVLRPSEQFELRDKMNIKEKLTVFLAARKNDEQLIKMGVLVRGATFGVPLQDVVKMAGKDGVPNIVRTLVDYMKAGDLLKIQGVFRVNGENGEIQNLKRIYDFESEKDLDLSKFGPHAITGCLKMFLRELPDPLFTYERYDPIVEAFRGGHMQLISEIIHGLPRDNLQTWNYIMDMLVLCQSHSATNMMGAKNLALVMSPNILRLRVETFAKIAQDTPVTVGAVEYLITAHANKLGIQVPSKGLSSETKDGKDEVPSLIQLGRTDPWILAAQAPLSVASPKNSSQRAPSPPRTQEGTKEAERPTAPSPGSPWRQYMDKASGHSYYHNTVTKETVWLKPADF